MRYEKTRSGTPEQSLNSGATIRFSDLVKVNPAVNCSKLKPDDRVSFIPMSDVTDNGQWIGKQTRTYAEVRNGYSVFQEEDVLFAKITPCTENGKGCHAIGLTNGIGFGSTEFHVLRAKTGVNTRLLYHLSVTKDVRTQAAGIMGGSAGHQRVPADFFKLFRLPASFLDNQERKAELFDAVDEVIEATRAVIEQTRRLKAALLQDLLTNGLPGRHRKSKSTKHLPDIPADWQILSLEQIGDGKRPVLRTGPFGSSLKTEHFTTSGRPVLIIGSLGESEILADELFYVDEEKAAELREYEVEPGDVVFSRVADVGRSVTIPEWAGGWIISSNLMRIAVDKSRFDPWFIRQSLVHSRHLKKQMRRLTADAGREIVNSDVLSDLLFPMPNRDEQNQIAEITRRIDERIWEEREVLSQLVKTKSALSQGLLTGRIPVMSPVKEVL